MTKAFKHMIDVIQINIYGNIIYAHKVKTRNVERHLCSPDLDL